ncbi:MAG: 3-dehydro-L-gulonate 2-dehydrogenase [Opitutaceae bacterium]|nr:3-dehydro-L-gulonate 2-dehydrogenase [Opitutaceae bacterium]
MPRVPFPDLVSELHHVLSRQGVPEPRAALVARLFAENQRDGVFSHGLYRFPGFVALLKSGRLDPHAEPVRVGGLGALEQWDGRMGIGLSNAHAAMGRAIELSRQHGLGCVGLRNTNHWMRAGAYGLQAADAGCIGICWTNTIPLMPPWGAAEVAVGNNPLAIAVPRAGGPLLLDMAMSQFANGKLEVFHRQGRELPVAGGFDRAGNLTRQPGEILASRRPMPIGYWKGSALAVMLDAAAALVSGGQTSQQIGRQGTEYAVSQVFIALNVTALAGMDEIEASVNALIEHLHATPPLAPGEPIRYPGEGMLRSRRESLAQGVFVEEGQLEALRNL